MKKGFALLAVLVLGLVAWAAMRPAPTTPLYVLPGEEPAADAAWTAAPRPATPPPATEGDDAEFDGIALDPAAIASLRGGREFGDPRTPPIGRSEPAEQASPEELADPQKYAEFEARQERKLKRAYVIEAEKYVSQLRQDVEKGKAMGISAEEIAKVEKKIQGIEAMRAKLLKDDPALLD